MLLTITLTKTVVDKDEAEALTGLVRDFVQPLPDVKLKAEILDVLLEE